MGSAGEQGTIWGARAADWAAANEPAWTAIFATVLDRAGVGPDSRHLDIGCGAGGALVQSAARGAVVAGLDAAAALADIARGRLPGTEIVTGEMEDLPFAADRFDVVTGINSFQFAASPEAALREAARVCRPGGRVAMMVWGPRQDCDLLRAVMPAVFALLPKPDGPPKPPPPDLSAPGVIEGMMDGAGLGDFEVHDFSGSLDFPDLGTALQACLAASARAIGHAGEANVRQALEGALGTFVAADGSVCLHNRFHMVVGHPTSA